MKKRICVLFMSMAFVANTVNVFAYRPQIIGSVLSTDIIAYIDKRPIRSYNHANSTYVLAEDLRNYGFEVIWNNQARTLNITLPENRTVKEISGAEKQALEKREPIGEKRYDVYKTDIQTLFDGAVMPSASVPSSINVDGKTLVLFSSLGKYFGEVEWNEQQRIANIYTKGGQVSIETYTTDFGLKYQETKSWSVKKDYYSRTEIATTESGKAIIAFNIILRDQNRDKLYNADGSVKEETYLEVTQALLDTFDLQISPLDTNQLTLETPKTKIELKNISTVNSYSPAFVSETNLSLYNKDKQVVRSNPDFPTFLSIDHKIYISGEALAKALGMTETLDQYGYGEGVFQKN